LTPHGRKRTLSGRKLIIQAPASYAFPLLSLQLLGGAQIIGTIGFGTAIPAYNCRLVTEAFDAFILIPCLECTHMHFVFFDITGHDVLPSLLIYKI
jgi:hypothetical protein